MKRRKKFFLSEGRYVSVGKIQDNQFVLLTSSLAFVNKEFSSFFRSDHFRSFCFPGSAFRDDFLNRYERLW